ncbi:CSPG4 [Branchiostoma lanceolatum]|uniref:CSPG4 protein n=1 Tax=Branchiostoma lanceolatum TaxID=7740 RepID=A0A8J9ZH57_BRALA|nr:CSPG4 [Branchiostoma lanceolatum]
MEAGRSGVVSCWMFLALVVFLCGESLAASFYGADHIHVKIDDANSQTDCYLRFRTSQRNGLVLLAEGKTDYLIIELNAGRVRIRIDLGGGEVLQESRPGIRVNDLEWHEVKVKRQAEKVSLIVDQTYTSTVNTPVGFYELNIHNGFYVGGDGTHHSRYLSSSQPFRGCISDATFNGFNLLSSLVSSEERIVSGVTPGCSREFFVTSEDPVSFLSDTSYIALEKWSSVASGSFECVFKTVAKSGILLYGSGAPLSSDFIALELNGGRVNVLMDKGNGMIEFASKFYVSDGVWHSIEFRFTATFFELTIDLKSETMQVDWGDNRYLDLLSYTFIGGVNTNIRSSARADGLSSILDRQDRGGSYIGCMKDLKINKREVTLRDALATENLDIVCATPEFPTVPTTVVSSTISQEEARAEISDSYMTINPLTVEEGGQASLSTDNIMINVDLKSIGVRYSGVLIRVTKPPKHGKIGQNVAGRTASQQFTLLDLENAFIYYEHDGTETRKDRIHFRLFFLANEDKVPPSLLREEGYVIKIEITPTNDAPEINLPTGPDNVFSLIQNTKRTVTSEVLSAEDPDSESSTLVFSVLNSPGQQDDTGYLERSDSPGVSIDTFTQEDVNLGKISYVHQGPKHSRLALRVSDKEKVSSTAVLRIIALDLELKEEINLGVEVTRGDFSLITPDVLSFETNSPEQDLPIRYDVTKAPLQGELQRLQSDGVWRPFTSFTQKNMQRKKVRYYSSDPLLVKKKLPTDSFTFTATCTGVKTGEFDFVIRIPAIKIKLVQNEQLVLKHIREKALSSRNLLTVLENIVSFDPDNVFYTVMKNPEKGELQRVFGNSKEVVSERTNFSQLDIEEERVSYALESTVRTEISDSFVFQISAYGAVSSLFQFNISYIPDRDSIFVTNTGMVVSEGEGKLLKPVFLKVETLNTDRFRYTVTRGPKYGKLQLIDSKSGEVAIDNVQRFTNQDIANQAVLYIHDDSESGDDSFSFQAVPVVGTAKSTYNDTFLISVDLKNDQAPERVVNKVVQVVTGADKLITTKELKYSDPDSGFDDSKLLYFLLGIPNGEVFYTNDTKTPIFTFSQLDLEQRRVIFRHDGSAYGRGVIRVSDGQFYSTGLLEVRASSPFISIVNNTGIVVQKGNRLAITLDNLAAITNINADRKDMVYVVTAGPTEGILEKDGKKITEFTQMDLYESRIVYRHSDGDGLRDDFNFTIKVKGTEVKGKFKVRAFLASYQKPPKVGTLKPLVVKEGKPAVITSQILSVTHPDSTPQEIVFTVTDAPKFGYLELMESFTDFDYQGDEAVSDSEDGTERMTSFTQQDVNDGRLQYVQTATNQLSDRFVLDVSNGILTSRDLVFEVEIVPKLVPVEVKNFTILEGASTPLVENIVKVSNRHFVGLAWVYELLEGPSSGQIESTRGPGVALRSFTSDQVRKQFVFYVHNGADTLRDQFTIRANATDGSTYSLPYTIYITVTPVNDATPQVEVNNGLSVWEGSVTVVSTDDLSATDADSSDENIVFEITTPNNGRMALRSKPWREILNFTQALLERGDIVFVHTGASTGGFRFQVNDGKNIDDRKIFTITAKPLVISLQNNNELKAYPRTRQVLTVQNLRAVTNDRKGNRTIVFTITSPPKLGKLVKVLPDNSTVDISSFTQEEVNKGVIAYLHRTLSEDSWTQVDQFMFNVSSSFADAIPEQVFQISILYNNGNIVNQTELSANIGLTITEGRGGTILMEHLDASNLLRRAGGEQLSDYIVRYNLTSLPRNGVLKLNDQNISRPVMLTQDKINQGQLRYKHDDSDTTADVFEFSVWLEKRGLATIQEQAVLKQKTLVSEKFNISISPVNDQPFKLLTKNPSLQVVQGFSTTITSENLNTVDPDNPPSDIVYRIINGPNNGYLAFLQNSSESIRTFTQKDINDGKLVYIQDGTPSRGVFYFQVSDGVHRPLFKLFNLVVVPVSVSLVNNTGANILQGSKSVAITRNHLSGYTNGKRENIMFQVLSPPKFGSIMLDNVTVSRFKQVDVDREKLVYIQRVLSEGMDSFKFTMYSSDSVLSNQTFNITVAPRLKVNDQKVTLGGWVHLNKDWIDGSELESLTGSPPKFRVIEDPTYGRLVDSATFVPVSEFTQRDLEAGTVMFLVNMVNITNKASITDMFSLMVAAEGVQPAVANVRVKLLPPKARSEELESTTNATFNESSVTDTYPVGSVTGVDTNLIDEDSDITDGVFKDPNVINRGGKPIQDGVDEFTQGNMPRSTEPSVGYGQNTGIINPRIRHDNLAVVIPIVVILVLLILIVIALVVFRMRKRDKRREDLPDGVVSIPPLNPESPDKLGSSPPMLLRGKMKGEKVPEVVPMHTTFSSKPECSPTMPCVKVTPLSGQGEDHKQKAGSPNGISMTSLSSGSEKLGYDWSGVDPELVSHCRTTAPTLKRNQYWV